MVTQIEGPVRTFNASVALGINLRVKQDASGDLVLAALADKEVGTLEKEAFAADEKVPVRLASAQGTVKMIASQAIAINASVFTDAAGKISDVAATGSFLIGVALTAATLDGDEVEVLRTGHGDTPTP